MLEYLVDNVVSDSAACDQQSTSGKEELDEDESKKFERPNLQMTQVAFWCLAFYP